VAAFEERLQDLSNEISSINSFLQSGTSVREEQTKLNSDVSRMKDDILKLANRIDNATYQSVSIAASQEKKASNALQSQFEAFQNKFIQMADTIRRMEGKVSTFVKEGYLRQGSIHRWIVGAEESEGRALNHTGPSATPNQVNLESIPFDPAMTISWRTECGCTGIALEAMNLVYPLWKAGVKIWLNKCDKGCDFGMPKEFQAMVDDMDKTRPEVDSENSQSRYYYSWNKPKRKKKHVYDIVVLHIAYAGICSTKDDRGDGRYIISRSMYEADSLKESEVARCNSDAINEVWVPTEFNVDSFASAGVNSNKVFQVGEGIDLHNTWNPALLKESKVDVMETLGLKGTKAGWNFMSLFKFEKRKNWKGLLEAYLTEFSKKDDVCFYLKTHEGWEGDPEEWIKTYLRTLARNKVVDPANLPCIYLIDSMIDSNMLPNLFHEMDAFVLASHAEGWGLPALEAMSMELPVVVTDWGGVTEFTGGYSARDRSKRNEFGKFPGGFAIRVAKLEPAFDGRGSGNWAVPSVAHLRKIMRHMYENQDDAREAGRIARQRALRFDRNVVASKILSNFNEIYADLIVPSLERKNRR